MNRQRTFAYVRTPILQNLMPTLCSDFPMDLLIAITYAKTAENCFHRTAYGRHDCLDISAIRRIKNTLVIKSDRSCAIGPRSISAVISSHFELHVNFMKRYDRPHMHIMPLRPDRAGSSSYRSRQKTTGASVCAHPVPVMSFITPEYNWHRSSSWWSTVHCRWFSPRIYNVGL